METLVKAWARARDLLTKAGVDSPVIDSRILLLAATGLTRMVLISEPHTQMSPEALETFNGFLARRVAREPVAHIVGFKGFWTLDLKSDARALVPRPETETIVDYVLKTAPAEAPINILDIATGSGTILLALLSERQAWRGLGTDISADALALAAENALVHGLTDRAGFIKTRWLEGIEVPPATWPAPEEASGFDIIVSNPPYIPSHHIGGLSPDVRDFDPHLALDGGADGLDPYRILLPQLATYLKPGGLFAFEFGIGQDEALLKMGQDAKGLTNIGILKDLSNKPRVLIGRKSA